MIFSRLFRGVAIRGVLPSTLCRESFDIYDMDFRSSTYEPCVASTDKQMCSARSVHESLHSIQYEELPAVIMAGLAC